MPYRIENGQKIITAFDDGRVYRGFIYDANKNAIEVIWNLPVTTDGGPTTARKAYKPYDLDEFAVEVQNGAAIAAAVGW